MCVQPYIDFQTHVYNNNTNVCCLSQDMVLKRRYARLQKAQGDVALLAGSPADAFDHYTGAIDLARVSNDAVWLAAALEGRVTAKVQQHDLMQRRHTWS